MCLHSLTAKTGNRLFITLLLLLMTTEPATAGSVFFSGAGQPYQISLQSWKERKFNRILQQRYDYSCGSAALASLLRFHYQHQVDSIDVFRDMYEQGDKNAINQQGFSMLDMKRYLKTLGYYAEGARLPIDRYLSLAAVPAIVMISTDGYQHFVVLKGIRKEKVLIGDPATGLRVLSLHEFRKMWNGLFFFITNEASVGRSSFDLESEWDMVASAPSRDAVNRMELGTLTLSLPHSNDFF